MLAEAADLRRCEVLRAARSSARGVVSPKSLLSFLTKAASLLGPLASRPRPRRGIGKRYLL